MVGDFQKSNGICRHMEGAAGRRSMTVLTEKRKGAGAPQITDFDRIGGVGETPALFLCAGGWR
jgi:hypothetical protein